MEHDVFISYSSKNSTTAQAIRHVLEQNNIRCWIAPDSIPGGSEYGDLIDEAIFNCKVFVLLFSEMASESSWVKAELNLAFTENKVIIPYRIDDSPLKGAMKLILNQKHWIDAYPNAEEKFKDLIEAVLKFVPERRVSPNVTGAEIEEGRGLLTEDISEMLKKAKSFFENEDYFEAFPLYKTLADNHCIDAYDPLGDMYHFGYGTAKDIKKAEHYYRLGAETGNDSSQLWLGQILRKKGDFKEALHWLIESANQGQGWSMFLVAEMYEKGEGTKKDIDTAIEWYKKSSKTTNAYAYNAREALERLCVPLFTYEEFESIDISRYMRISPKVLVAKAEKYQRGWGGAEIDYPTAYAMLLAAAAQGSARAEEKLGEISTDFNFPINSEVEAQKHFEKALSLYLKAIENGDADACEHAGDFYKRGLGCPKDIDRAIFCYRIGSDQGNAACQLQLGQLLEGKGQYAEALHFYELAGGQGQGCAAYLAGKMYEEGRVNVKIDIDKAIEWYAKSSKTNSRYADDSNRALKRLLAKR